MSLPDEVWESESCASRPLPYLRLNRSDVMPNTAKPGEEIVYTFSYTACVPERPGYVLGELVTFIYLGERLISKRSDHQYPIDTGEWVVNTKVAIPKNAELGAYDVEATLSADGKTIMDSISFAVEE